MSFADDAADPPIILNGWWVEGAAVAGSAAPRRYMLYSHGSGMNDAVAYRRERYERYVSLGISFLVYDYPGYGKSEGVANEKSIYSAAEAALSFVRAATGEPTESILNLGRSMGGAVAVELATRHEFRATLLQSTFTSYGEAAAVGMPVAGWVISAVIDPLMENIRKIGEIRHCLYLYSGDDDEFIPMQMGEALFQAADQVPATCKTFDTQPGVKHGDPITDHEAAELGLFLARLDEAEAGGGEQERGGGVEAGSSPLREEG